jgi:putative oxygen-independent coproporphyrinogen III oxidase
MVGFQREWRHWFPYLQDKTIRSVYFGGGTPSLLGPERIAEILSWIGSPIEEVTLEANPEQVTPALMAAYREAGINRVSLGLQTLDDQLLARLSRTHTAKQAIEAVEAVVTSGIANLSVDLMYDIPYQTLSSWQQTLERLAPLPISHLSLYNLTFEPHTPFYKRRSRLQPAVPDPDASLQMYLSAVEKLQEMGLEQYEISAFAKKGFQSRHNVGYWTARPFLGFGPSAFSYWEGRRFRNVAHLQRYSKALEAGHSPIDFTEALEDGARRRELLAIQLRLVEGVNLPLFEERHGPLDEEVKATLLHLQELGLLEWQDDLITLLPKGRLFYDTVAVELI